MSAVIEAISEPVVNPPPAARVLSSVANKPRRKMGWVWLVFLPALALPFVAPGGVLARVITTAVEVPAIVLLFRRVRSPALQNRKAWTGVAAAIAFWFAGDLVVTFYLTVLHRPAPAPGLPDPFFISAYLIGAWSMFRLTSERSGKGLGLDAAIMTIGLGASLYMFWLEPVLEQSAAAPVKTLTMAYVLADFLLIAIVGRTIMARKKPSRAIQILGASFVLLFVMDFLQSVALSGGHMEWLRFIQTGWLGVSTLMVVAAWHPSAESPPSVSWEGSRLRLAPLIVVSMLVPVSVLVSLFQRNDQEVVAAGVAAAAVMFALTLTRAARATRALEEVSKDREELLSLALNGAEDERGRLAAELHDGPIQRLAAVGYGMESARRRLEAGDIPRARAIQVDSQTRLEQEIGELRRVMSELRPPALDEVGLPGAIRDLVDAFGRSSGLPCRVVIDPIQELSPEVETVIYRVAQEALRNVERHAEATVVTLELGQRNGRTTLTIVDDGNGFASTRVTDALRSGRYGLAAMAHRVKIAGGSLQIVSTPGSGTNVSASLQGRRRPA